MDCSNRRGEILPPRLSLHHALIVSDENTNPYAVQIADQLFEAGTPCEVLSLPAGETSKSAARLAELWNRMLTAGADRRSTVIAVGGGVVGDLAGFAAATFARGIPFVQIPTTLLAQVDSSVGGKTGINLAAAKNIIGAFWQPQLVVADVQTLITLPPREFVSGLAEVVKYGVIADAELFTRLESMAQSLDSSHEELPAIIERCCQIKASVVADDERETSGQRQAELWSHDRACARGDLRTGAVAAWRSRRHRHALRSADGGRSGNVGRIRLCIGNSNCAKDSACRRTLRTLIWTPCGKPSRTIRKRIAIEFALYSPPRSERFSWLAVFSERKSSGS